MRHPLNIDFDAAFKAVWAKAREHYLDMHEAGAGLDYIINDTLYHEQHRLKEARSSKAREAELRFYRQINQRLKQKDLGNYLELLELLTRRYVGEIKGSFKPWVYRFTTGFLPRIIASWFNPFSAKRFIQKTDIRDLDNTLIIDGPVEQIQRLERLGTVMYAPTHLSHFDSILIGLVLFRSGLKPVSYGAGLNLFTNPLLSFFMSNLGSYKIDRRKKGAVYKDTLKFYSEFLLENGINTLFFPGGTRNRSGAIEQRLKLGLLGTSVTALINKLKTKQAAPNVYIVPCTISYQLVLEASNLIEDYLKAEGKSMYIMIDEAFSKLGQVSAFIRNLINMNSKIYFRFCEPLDPFGNRVNGEGRSVDPHGRPIDVAKYLEHEGRIRHRPQRDAQYTVLLGEKILESFRKHNVITTTCMVAYCVFKKLAAACPEKSLFRLLETDFSEYRIGINELFSDFEALYGKLAAMQKEGKLMLCPDLKQDNLRKEFVQAIRTLATYHRQTTVLVDGNYIVPNHPQRLFYYRNKLSGYGL